jgi:hypothetical protein
MFSSPTRIASSVFCRSTQSYGALLASPIKRSSGVINLEEKSNRSPRQRRMHGIKLDDDVSNFLEPVHPVDQFHPNQFNFRSLFLFIFQKCFQRRPCLGYALKGVGLKTNTFKRVALLLEVFAVECLSPQRLSFDNASRRRIMWLFFFFSDLGMCRMLCRRYRCLSKLTCRI